MKSNYLSEFRTLLEKAKARKNLGIGDEYNLAWGNITGHIEDNADLVNFIENQWKYSYVSPYIQLQINTVKEALDYALYYVSTYEANDLAVTLLSQEFDVLTLHVDQVAEQLQQGIDDNGTSIELIEAALNDINQQISQINYNILNIDVDNNIEAWMESKLELSKTIEIRYVDVPDGEVDENGDPTTITFRIIEVKVSLDANNAIEVRNDGLYVKDYNEDIDSINDDIEDLQNTLLNIKQSLTDLTYNTLLPDSTTSPVHEGVTVEDLKNKTLTEILDTVLFPSSVRPLVNPFVRYSDIPTLVEVNSAILVPTVEYQQGDAGELIDSSSILTFNNSVYDLDYYGSPGSYTFTATYLFEAGDYLSNNRGEVTDIRVELGEVTTTKLVLATYPWYAGSVEEGVTKQILVPINEASGVIDFSLTKHAIIKIPGAHSTLSSFRLDSGLGYLDVDMDGWTYSNETIEGITYKVWTKQDSYAAILPHRINFTIII